MAIVQRATRATSNKTETASNSNTQQGGAQAATRGHDSYAAQSAALAPGNQGSYASQAAALAAGGGAPVQMKGIHDEAAAVLVPPSPDLVQMKGGGKEEKDGPGPPAAIKALGLQKVTVACSIAHWKLLTKIEKGNVITLLLAKDAACLDEENRLESAEITIRERHVKKVEGHRGKSSRATVAGLEKEAAANNEQMKAGERPTTGNRVIHVEAGPIETVLDSKKEMTYAPVTTTETMSSHIDSKGANFDSADYESQDMLQADVIALLEQAAQAITRFREVDPNAKVSLTVVASESKVTNPPEFEGEGKLAAARANNGLALAKAHLGAANISMSNISFSVNPYPKAGGPEWNNKLKKGDKGYKGKDHADYTAHQFVRLEVNADVTVTRPGTIGRLKEVETEQDVQEAMSLTLNIKEDRGEEKVTPPKSSKSPKKRVGPKGNDTCDAFG
jgi:hypothetical protein